MGKRVGTTVESLTNNLFDKISRRLKRYTKKLFPKKVWKYMITEPEKMGVLFIMDAEGYYMIPTKNIIPIYLDFARNMIDEIMEATQDLPAFFVASKDIYNEMKSKGCQNVYFIHQCVSDQYFTQEIPEKI